MNYSHETAYLNTLICLNYDRIACYSHATHLLNHTVKGLDAAPFFAQLAQGCLKNIKALSADVVKLEGTPAEGQTLVGKTLLLWMEVQASVASDPLHVIMSACLRVNRHAFRGYERAIGSGAPLPDATRQRLLDQKIMLESSSNLITTYKDLQSTYLVSEQAITQKI